MLVVFILNQPCKIVRKPPCRDCAYLLININEASPWTGNMLVVFILNQPCKTAHLQTVYIWKPFTSLQIPISLHKSENNFSGRGFQMRAVIQSLQISTPSAVLRFDCVVGGKLATAPLFFISYQIV